MIDVNDTTAPSVTLTQPASNATLATTLPTFAGKAGNAVGDTATVTVKVYAGSSATGSPAADAERDPGGQQQLFGHRQRTTRQRHVHRAGRAARHGRQHRPQPDEDVPSLGYDTAGGEPDAAGRRRHRDDRETRALPASRATRSGTPPP